MWSRKAAIESSIPIDLWPTVLEAALDKTRLGQYLANAEAMRLYFSWHSPKQIEALTGVPRRNLPSLARRCLKLCHDGQILGFRALIPYTRTELYTRRAALGSHFPGERGGMAGALNLTLERFPDIEKMLVKFIRNEAKRFAVPEYKLRACDLHRIFLRYLEENGVGKQEWPYNTKYIGLRTIQTYMNDVLNRNFGKTTAARENSAARAHLNVGRGVSALLSFDEPYDAVEIDTYKIEAHLSVVFRTPEGMETDVRLDRLCLIAAVDRFSSCILGYTVVYRPEISADDVLRLMRETTTTAWQPMELTIPGLRYPEGGGLPSGVVDGMHGAVWSVTMLDGALAHLSQTIHERARATLGFAINWGPVAHFERRPNVERTFNQIGKALFKRMPSTTGASPQNGRADEAERKAVLHQIRAIEVEQLLDVFIAQHNATPSEGLSYLSPLDAIRYFAARPDTFQVRLLPATGVFRKAFQNYEAAFVRGDRTKGRRPYVQLDRVHYTSPVLATSGHLIGERLLLEIDHEDMRQVKAYLSNGAELGILKAHGKWGLTKHSRRTRKAINGLISKRMLVVTEFDDPMQVYMRHLAAQKKGKRSDAGPSPKQASEIVRIKKEANQPPGTIFAAPAPVAVAPRRLSDELIDRPLLDQPLGLFTKVKNRR